MPFAIIFRKRQPGKMTKALIRRYRGIFPVPAHIRRSRQAASAGTTFAQSPLRMRRGS
jgi:hypothetical protein